MSVTLRPMTVHEFESFRQWSTESQAKELMVQLHIAWEAALRKAEGELAEMLPDGLHTEHSHLMTIIEADTEETAGFIWTLYEETAGRKQSFVCDFAIRESKRRNGYGTAALLLAERYAAAAGCIESVLFVSAGNAAARALYEKCGYGILRQSGSGCYMIKQL